jgi:hypothetical protein
MTGRRRKMKANELRVGNIIQYHDKTIKVTGIVNNTIYYSDSKYFDSNIGGYKPFQPIPLTEDWLKRFGFEYFNEYSVGARWKLNNVTIRLSFNKIFCMNYGIGIYADCSNVHQLQNLYFALTGEELTKR